MTDVRGQMMESDICHPYQMSHVRWSDSRNLIPVIGLCHLESRAASEPEYLRAVVGLLRQRVGKVKPQWAERRVPDQAHTDRRPDVAVAGTCQCFTGLGPGGRPNVVQ